MPDRTDIDNPREWVWDLQDLVEDHARTLALLASVPLLGLAIAHTVQGQWNTICTWWGIPPTHQVWTIGLTAASLYTLGVGHGYAVRSS
jgi:hypothetical protein